MKDLIYDLITIYIALSVIAAIFGFFVGITGSVGCNKTKFTRRWHYVFPAHYVGCWMGEKIER